MCANSGFQFMAISVSEFLKVPVDRGVSGIATFHKENVGHMKRAKHTAL
jgi:hypothetical protein